MLDKKTHLKGAYVQASQKKWERGPIIWYTNKSWGGKIMSPGACALLLIQRKVESTLPFLPWTIFQSFPALRVTPSHPPTHTHTDTVCFEGKGLAALCPGSAGSSEGIKVV